MCIFPPAGRFVPVMALLAQDLPREGREAVPSGQETAVLYFFSKLTEIRKWDVFTRDALLYRVTGWDCGVSMRLLLVFYSARRCRSCCL